MATGWLNPEKYERVEILGCTGPGTMADGYAWKVILHTTESPYGSIEGVRALFQSKPCYCPQFTIDPGGSRRRMQHIPWTWSGAALRSGRGGLETNRARTIQVEIVGYANDAAGWSDDVLWQIADFVADLIKDGAPINLDNVTGPDYQGTVAIESSPYRLQGDRWRHFDGLGGHIDAPFQDHYDPYRLDKGKIAGLAKEILAGAGVPSPVPAPAPVALPPAPDDPRPEFIQFGMTGGLVKFAQELLVALGYDLGEAGADGIFGPATDSAVRAFQYATGLECDGIVGPLTQAALNRAYHPSVDVPGAEPGWPGRYLLVQVPRLSGDDVRQWQARMSERGWPIGVDGVFGSESAATCCLFQEEKLLSVDGVVGPLTWQATWSAPVT
jgi:peptidoglycan hydrolase-like protein with peptidoglycan-binding domain